MTETEDLLSKNKADARRRALELKDRHPWIAEKADEIREAFGGFDGLRIYEDSELVWQWQRKTGE